MPYADLFSKFTSWPGVEDLNRLKPPNICTFLSHPVRFVQQKHDNKESLSSLYELRVFLQGEVNTRPNNLHDFFNALVWYTFPKVKAVLNLRHFIAYDEIADFPWTRPVCQRTREQDLLTLFDEGGCILVHFPIGAGIQIPFIVGHGFYEELYAQQMDMSALVIEVKLEYILSNENLFFPNGAKTRCDLILGKNPGLFSQIITTVDEIVANKLRTRSFWQNRENFYHIPRAKMAELLENFNIGEKSRFNYH